MHDLGTAREFYGDLLGCAEGRSSEAWVDFNFFGHQIVAHLASEHPGAATKAPVAGQGVPVPHFGLVLPMAEWKILRNRLTGKVKFEIEPYIRFEGQAGEQATMFFYDPSGNALEIKAMADPDDLFRA